MVKEKGKPTRGVLRQSKANLIAKHNRFFANENLDFFIEHYWTVSWDLTNKDPYLAETLPYPSIHIVFEKGNSKIFGVTKGRFSTLLQGKGSVFGIKFRPGGFFPFLQKNISILTNKTIPISDLTKVNILSLESSIFEKEDDESRIKIIETWLETILPEKDPKVLIINHIIDRVKSDRSIQSVDQVSKLFSMSLRNLQRLFQEYVGVSPKWVIQRFRIQEVAELIEKEKKIHYAAMALDLGYYDQSHFIKDFKNTIGLSPEEYLKSIV
ncbi:helix-turn-helix transcriptional regulator [Leptospira sp. 2 VSF19]|uniref:Helix-turn-helix transcriptional regulator n=1 Tax=Leptospira soteropolitanensis TaxID=2950025 RepID=A0AAW5VD10_9LEPT|nr:helix-turn-helix transcriptional regulator [Leptospira soteropolitanensis]MCW7491937.1 helix-turn-helix transcriptional regulator [Leptospira soteropolitanensis]MCW7499521.1 helix-turn-helix transcriptional regulator [Leptospira soteropolitanensis]MCW7520888.1 helix-turn-helix transcriptional regulator [Leptospira soteropolitanensis]MCW7525625.1 helix-turn-helix transcriptional regulator [Leptospira soteropolitanensis]MCW7529491.1 helix-turn-helix transcriptional regulator [Leptospira soter